MLLTITKLPKKAGTYKIRKDKMKSRAYVRWVMTKVRKNKWNKRSKSGIIHPHHIKWYQLSNSKQNYSVWITFLWQQTYIWWTLWWEIQWYIWW
jgi:hypothetical protein